MKRALALVLSVIFVFSAMILTSCSGEKDSKNTTTTTTATTTTSGKSDNLADVTTTQKKDDNDPNTPSDGETVIEIGDATALAEFAEGINNGTYEADTDAKLTADIDMSGYSDTTTWNPIYVYSGTLDGNGHVIKNFNWTFTMENSANGDMPTHDKVGTYIIENTNNVNGDNSFADAGIALLVINLDGGEIKNLTLEDSSLTIVCSYNKNYNTFVSGVVAYANAGKLTSVTAKNVNVTVPAQVNYNQGAQGYCSQILACGEGETVLSSCKVEGGVLDCSANIKFNAGSVMGLFRGESPSLEGCSSNAEIKVASSDKFNVNDLMWKNGDNLFGGKSSALCCSPELQ